MSPWIIAFVVLAVIELGAELADLRWLIYATKPTAMSMLIGYAITRDYQAKKTMIFALAFCMLGDIILMLPSRPFVPGLVAFLIGHIGYIAVFTAQRGPHEAAPAKWILRAIVAVFSVLCVVVLYPKLGSMRIPVLAYIAVISTMTVAATQRPLGTNPKRFYLVALGAMLFMASDTMIAVNRFVVPFEASRFLIMASYFGAQLMITYGATMSLGHASESA